MKYYSHSIVAGGFELMSYTTRLTPLTPLMILFEIFARNSYGKCDQSAVIPSVELTARRALLQLAKPRHTSHLRTDLKYRYDQPPVEFVLSHE